MSDYIKHDKSLQDELKDDFAPKKNSSITLANTYDFLDRLCRDPEAYSETVSEFGFDFVGFNSPIKFGNKFDRTINCGSFLEFKVSSEEHKLHKANFCRDRLCPMCQWRRSMKIFSQVSSCMDWIQSKHPEARFVLLTLTLRNCSGRDLPETLSLMRNAFRKLVHDNLSLRKLLLGSFCSLEITYNHTDGTFHPHFHVILALPQKYFRGDSGFYITQKQWASLWASAADLDYIPIVDIRAIKDRGKGIYKAVAEVSKYAVKDADYLKFDLFTNARLVYFLSIALLGRRLCSFSGIFREARQSLKLDSIEEGDLVLTGNELIRDDLSFVIKRYQWRFGVYASLD